MPTSPTVWGAALAATLIALFPAFPAVAETLARGGLEGRSGHVATGTAYLIEQDGTTYIHFGEDFEFDGAPDPKVALGNDGYDPQTQSGDLASNAGAQSYPLADGIDPAAYNEIWIWCEEVGVPLAVATIR